MSSSEMISVGHWIDSLHDDVSTSNLYGDGVGIDGAVAVVGVDVVAVFECLLGGATGLAVVVALCTLLLFSTFPAETDRTLLRGGATSLLDCMFCN